MDAASAMQDYFAGEKLGGFVLLGMGAVALVAGGVLFRATAAIRKGASYPLLAFGVLLIAAGIFIYVSSNNRIDAFGASIAADTAAWLATERPRMDGVATQFVVLKVVWVVLIVGGAAMAVLGRPRGRLKVAGAGISIAILAAALLVFDFTAAARAGTYRDRLVAISPSPRTGP